MEKYLNTAGSDWYKSRLAGFIYLIVAAFGILVLRLFYLQIIEGKDFRKLSKNNCIRLKPIDPLRGLIYDRKGTLLVDNRPSFDLSIVLKDAHPLETTIQKLSEYTLIPASEIKKKISHNQPVYSYRPLLLKRDIGRDMLAAIEVHKFDLPGIVIDVCPRRHYIRSKNAAHLLGYLGEINQEELKSGLYPKYRGGDLIGKFGVEETCERFLRGKRGGRQVEVNAAGQIVRILETVDAEPGHNVFLTIDQELQETTEHLLEGKAGAVVSMDPFSGDILAMASSPSFDQNAFVSGLSSKQWNDLTSNPFRPMQNKAIQGEYPPASTYKIITAMAGLEEGVIDENTAFFCPGYLRFGDRNFRCWKRYGHGKMNVTDALIQSCDVFFYQVGLRLGIDRLAWYAKACGLGELTGIDLKHEANGLIPTARWKKRRTGISWQRGETLSVAIGQGYNLVTPVQMAVLISAVANGGTRYRPQVIDKIETADGRIVKKAEKIVKGKIPISQKNLAIIRNALWAVVNQKKGTAHGIHLKEMDICGKTGTAQVVGNKTLETLKENKELKNIKSHAWFVAYAPSNKPKIAVAVIVEHGEHGSSAAAPIAQALIKSYLNPDGVKTENEECRQP